MELKIYEHKAQYYETDQMGIIHHANYLHWFEEARIDMMEQMGMGYDIMEKQGIISPVLSVHCDYKSMARFGETVQVLVQMKEYNGIRMTLEYTVFDKETGGLQFLRVCGIMIEHLFQFCPVAFGEPQSIFQPVVLRRTGRE